MAGVARQVAGSSCDGKVAGSMPSQGPGSIPVLPMYGRQPIGVSLSHPCLSLSLPLSLPLKLPSYLKKSLSVPHARNGSRPLSYTIYKNKLKMD